MTRKGRIVWKRRKQTDRKNLKSGDLHGAEPPSVRGIKNGGQIQTHSMLTPKEDCEAQKRTIPLLEGNRETVLVRRS
jgi:hypothetical protein